MNKEIAALQTFTSFELLDKEIPPVKSIINRILPIGTYIFAGASKIGKSWMALWFANKIALGEPVWCFNTTQNEVLYLALEDTERRLQERLNEVADTVGTFHFATKSACIGEGLEEQLVNFIEKFPKVKLIINDAVNTISGTNGIAGSADGAFVLHKSDRNQSEAKLFVTGRDIENIILTLNFNSENCIWDLKSHTDENVTSDTGPVLNVIAEFMQNQGKWQGTATALLKALNLTDTKPNALTRKLNSNADVLMSSFNICYYNKRVNTEKHIFLQNVMYDLCDKTVISENVEEKIVIAKQSLDDFFKTIHCSKNTDKIVHSDHK